MDFPTKELDTSVGRWASSLALLLTLSAVVLALVYEVMAGVVVFATTICVVGLDIASTWNTDLKRTGFAPAQSIQSAIVGVLIFFAVLVPPLTQLFEGLVHGAILANILALSYLGILYLVAFNGVAWKHLHVGEDPRTNLKSVYVDESTFITRVENAALERRNKSDESS